MTATRIIAYFAQSNLIFTLHNQTTSDLSQAYYFAAKTVRLSQLRNHNLVKKLIKNNLVIEN
ncbi:MAG: hypothetical protein QNJ49_12330 [Mastigocoleus sp. MO_167.B18]|uniref:hypothetical protein n=1 Tax=Mastigocoleus sp. MO_188.B34 TaxID=3036635 RepID=UPI0026130500|nr:hypothetical protein [Mastigocoleus sp. MO_188.B34]MDJ0694169.1 hypothetical protein [Mastigocoleus sp. MO_188.B34]MDJ0774190.1 hypothetical protein [Mastigocoleus sp. MO_167.B18]